MFEKITRFTFRFRWPMLLLLLLWTLFMGFKTTQLKIDPTTDPLFVKSSQEYQDYRKFTEKFGSDHMIAIAMSSQDLFTYEELWSLKELTEELQHYDEVDRVMSIANVKDIQPKMIGVKVVPVLEAFFEGKETAEEVREVILENELYLNNLISREGTVANIVLFLEPGKDSRNSKGAFLEDLNKLLKSYETTDRVFYLAGAPVEQFEFIRYIRKDQKIFIPLITLLLIITTWCIYRNFACMVLSMALVFMTLIWSMGTIVLLGQELNLVTSLLATVIMIVAVVNSIHLMNLFFEIRGSHQSLKESIVLTMSQLGVPCLLSHFTTILGFASLMLNPIPAIQSFGMFAALGTFYSYLTEIFLTPILLPILPYRRRDNQAESSQFLNRTITSFLERIEFKGKWWILFANAALLVFSLNGISKIEVDTGLIKQMKPDSPLAVATRFIDQHLTGVYVLGFIFERKDGEPLMDQESLQKIDGFKTFFESKPEIMKVNSLTTLLKKINWAREDQKKGYEIPSNERIQTYLEKMAESGDPELWKLVTPDFKQVRLEARMKAVGTKRGAQVEEDALAYLNEHLTDTLDYHLTGNVVLLGKMAKGLVYYQLKGFATAFVAIMIVIAVLFKSVRMGLLAAIPNLFPIITVYGLMGYLGIELSTPTAMISSIVLGMAVDASIHFLHRFKYEYERRHHYLQALHHTFRNVGLSLVTSTTILTVGFASSIFASFRPTVYLGVLTSLTIFFALLCTLVLLPVCLVMLKPFGRAPLFAKR